MDEQTVGPLVSVVIPTRNRPEKLARCLESVYSSNYWHFETLVVDDASNEPVERMLSSTFPDTRFVRNPTRRLLSFSRNLGAARATGDLLLFLDDDNVLDAGAIGALAGCLTRKEVGVSCPLIYYMAEPDKVWTSSITRSKLPGFYTLRSNVPEGPLETFSFHNSFMVKRSVFEEVGGFDSVNFPIRFAEIDLAHRLHSRGYRAVVTPLAKVWHDLGWSLVHIDSTRAYYTERNRIILLKRYFDRRDLLFYEVCILPFIGSYYLIQQPLSTSDGRMKTATRFLRGTVSGLRFEEEHGGKRRARR